MNKKKLSVIITVVVVAIIAVVAIVSMKSADKPKSEIDAIINSEISTVEKTNKISEMTASKKADCDSMKQQIIALLSNLNKEEITYKSDDEVSDKFEDYYSDAMDKIESKLEFYEVRNAIEYGSSPHVSITMASDEYNEISAFYNELQEIYNQLSALS